MINMGQLQPWDSQTSKTPPSALGQYGGSGMQITNPYGQNYGSAGALNADPNNRFSSLGGIDPSTLGAGSGGQIGQPGMGLDNNGVLYPGEWGQSANMWQGYGNTKVGTPSSWTTGMNALTPMAQTGQPVSSDPWWTAMQKNTAYNTENAIKNAAEQAGLSGLRWSTPMGRQAQEIAGNFQNQAAQQWADREMAAQEAARQRQLGATSQLYQYGQGQYQMSQDELARQAAAASAMGNLGSQKASFTRGLASDLFNMGNSMYGMQRQEVGDSYGNPYMDYGMDYLSRQQTGLPQTYDQSTMSQILGAAQGAMPYAYDYLSNRNQSNDTSSNINPYWNPSADWTY